MVEVVDAQEELSPLDVIAVTLEGVILAPRAMLCVVSGSDVVLAAGVADEPADNATEA